MRDIIGRKLAAGGPSLANPSGMSDGERTVPLVKEYPHPEFRTKPPEDEPARLRLELKMLRMELTAIKDQRRRLREEIKDTITLLTEALEDDKQETVDQLRRRISRLKGSLEYPGRYDYVMKER